MLVYFQETIKKVPECVHNRIWFKTQRIYVNISFNIVINSPLPYLSSNHIHKYEDLHIFGYDMKNVRRYVK